MSIKVGDHAPDFSLVGLGEGGPEIVTLSKITGEQNILILFVPMAFTSVCTQEFCDISAGLGAYSDLNCKVLGISGDNPFAQAAWAEKEGISLQLLSDYDHKVTEAYGIAYDQFQLITLWNVSPKSLTNQINNPSMGIGSRSIFNCE